MTSLATSLLSANLAALGERNRPLVERVMAASPRPDLVFHDTRIPGAPTAELGGALLASRHQPRAEAGRLVEQVDVVEHAVVVVLGFGLGYHVEALARRLGRAGVIIVFEPDVALLRTVLERIDHAEWMHGAMLVFVTDERDRAALPQALRGAEAIIAQGVHILEHPASRARLAGAGDRFAALFRDHVEIARTTLMTTLVRSVETVRNQLLNLDHYCAGPGITDLAGAAAGRLGVVVSAGPSLSRNLPALAEPGVRDRCVIIAVQTTLKPLLAAGVRPHYVTALDYHEISRRFYEGLTKEDVAGITLVAEPKAHPSILDAFPGEIRCCSAPLLDRILGPLARDMGTLPAGATVAHLALYLARFLGCDPIALVGQDLGFTDGLYYAPGTAIHDVWAPELGPFNTIAMMEWQRIVRHRRHLHRTVDHAGRPIYTDAQMLAYLRQFERDLAEYERDGICVIDATEGGVAKQHVIVQPLARVLAEAPRADGARPTARPSAPAEAPALPLVARRLGDVRREVREVGALSQRTRRVLERMLVDQDDPARMARHFAAVEGARRAMESRMETFDLVGQLNQLGTFKRLRTDRRLHMRGDLEGRDRQRAQIDRDLENVGWVAEAAAELARQLEAAQRLVAGAPVPSRRAPAGARRADRTRPARAARIAAILPVDLERSGLGAARSLGELFTGRSLIQATLERLARVGGIESIILLAAEGADVAALIDPRRIAVPVEIDRTAASPFGPERIAIGTARRFAPTAWRGGIGGMSIFDEVLCPRPMLDAMERRGLDAAILAAPDWPLVDPGFAGALAERYREHPEQHRLVFTQAPPGLGACLVAAPLMRDLAARGRTATIGALLVHQPAAPQGDPIAREGNVQIDPRVRGAIMRAALDAPRDRRLVRRALAAGASADDPAAIAEALERLAADPEAGDLPAHVIVEATVARTARGLFAAHPGPPPRRGSMPVALAERLFAAMGAGAAGDWIVTFGGAGDPLLHEDLAALIGAARSAGAAAVHVRTELRADRAAIDRLLAAAPDVVSVDLHADTAATYEVMMGAPDFPGVIENMQHVLGRRRHLAGPPGLAGLALPWIVPRLQRRAETLVEVEPFFDRWQHLLGTPVIEAPPAFPARAGFRADALIPAVTPPRVVRREALRRMLVHADGRVPVRELDLAGAECAGSVATDDVARLWLDLVARRCAIMEHEGARALEGLHP